MSSTAASATRSRRREGFALLTYLALLCVLVTLAVAMVSNYLDARAALAESEETLAHLERRSSAASAAEASGPTIERGRPFLTGKTVTVAGAALQERVETAVRKAGGRVLSSRIDLEIPRAAEGFVGLTESLEIKQADLQALLYDLEAGMPYLFVGDLSIQSPQAFGEAEGARMRVDMGVTGQWREDQ